MIAFLQGRISKKWEQKIILMVSGVGYLVQVTRDLISSIKENEDIELFIFTRVREDEISLFGFRKETYLRVFQALIGVSGIGTKTAMAILDIPLEHTIKALQEENVAALTRTPGLGKKTAARLILELKGKFDLFDMGVRNTKSLPSSVQEEALDALQNLGYDKPSIIRFLNTTDESFESAEEAVKCFLQQ